MSSQAAQPQSDPVQLSPAQDEAIDTLLRKANSLLERTERQILLLLSLFHRPASPTALDALLVVPVIKGLSDHAPEHLILPPPSIWQRLGLWRSHHHAEGADPAITREDAGKLWQDAVKALRDKTLVNPPSDSHPDYLSAPENVRQRVSEHLRRHNRDAWQAGHLRLFSYYQRLLANRHPRTLAEMEPLYAAIVHGCAADQHQHAFERVYEDRMLQRQSLYLGKQLRAYEAWLEVLERFFDEPWVKPHANLKPASQRTALAQAGFALRGAGRLTEATKPIRAAVELAIELEDWAAASAEAQNLSEILSTLGNLHDSLLIARDSVRFAEKTPDTIRRLSARSRLGDALHQFGEPRLAARNFRRAERWQRMARKDLPYLISLRHYNYADLLLELGRHDEVRVRGLYALEVSREFQGLGMGPWDIALDKLSIARAAHAQWRDAQGLSNVPFAPPSIDEDGDPDAHPGEEDQTVTDTLPASVPTVPQIKQETIEENKLETDHHDVATRAYDQSVDELRETRQVQHLPAALIGRAAFRKDNRDFEGARTDLDEAARVASQGPMPLYQADIALARIHLALAQDAKLSNQELRDTINKLWLEARDIIQASGYHRRDHELEQLKAHLRALPGL